MENSKSFFWPQGILIALVGLVGTFSLGLMMLVKPNASDAQGQPSISETTISAQAGTQQRIESLKATMLTSWQQQAQAKGMAYPLPASVVGATIKAAKLTQGQKVIALTFDDGPWPESTAQVLDILKKNDIKATFFVVGQNVKNFPDILKRVAAEGHTVANHTWHHWYHFMNAQTAAYEVDNTTDIIFKTTGVKTNLFRPPGGMMHNGVANYAKNSKYAVIMWSSDSMDYSRPSVPRLINNVFREAKPGGIVLMHDGGGNRSQTVEALPTIIARFKKEGYSFVTIPELLEMQDKDQKLIANKK
ncbi:polysaccharide deacetylase [Tolypothrix tenuis PCC 7101]|uniref:Polysaccharide deacetylase n=1 Tax=Tolypothrix tenuis PCC 7101 TaxID=231146 RepID=A0A1Z4N7N4_9CYAN|nr:MULTISPECIES: polysaccharide deacetylase family protein [unclassified Tolypothrix]MBD2238685.1 polysaccharide deacetylase family protein [Aulosira sp. FACHB-113]BAY91777.1 polysaccharide deacetylase [Microchaete diplosiphon NIES-3275]BAZ01740.1 polysaccharide deacetylase [Tolypothrix tenuis PCC 7101]BAZ74335.1 polysaccharide deacetylase [Aulosira laxa NIES-50]EKF05081.1 polysaccharide deacetylase [Tolypothrix sp. PCC 7601]